MADPTEEKNPAGEQEERVEKLRAVLDGWWNG